MISFFDLFTVGIGPSSSHTVGPMRAARRFTDALGASPEAERLDRVSVELFGSLGLTGRGHGTDAAVIAGLMGFKPDEVDPDRIPEIVAEVGSTHALVFSDGRTVSFDPGEDMRFHADRRLSHHPNAMLFEAWAGGEPVLAQTWFSVGGGFIATEAELEEGPSTDPAAGIPYPFATAAELLELTSGTGMSIAELALANEHTRRSEAEVREGVLAIWDAMRRCVERGVATDGVLPGGLRVKRRAPEMHRQLCGESPSDLLGHVDWLNVWALAVNEENAAGGRVVTAPTNGAAGIVPAVLHYYDRFVPGADEDGIVEFLITAGAIGSLFKQMASISGAEVGCQGEVGSACSMAAAGLTAALGGSPGQVENAAEIGMEHNLGLTCDPIGGLVQIPCIERNAMGAVKAINASRMALRGDGKHKVSLDKVIKTMRDTGRDMQDKYKETSRGGLAVNVIEC